MANRDPGATPEVTAEIVRVDPVSANALAFREREDRYLDQVGLNVLIEGTPENTAKAYANDWAQFEAWAKKGARSVAPAEDTTLMRYMSHLFDLGRKPSTISRKVSGILDTHDRRYPSVKLRTDRVNAYLKKIRVAGGTALRQAAPLSLDDLRKIVKTMDAHPGDITRRDRALILLGWFGAFRRSELAALDISDIQQAREGLVVRLAKSKTDQEKRGTDVAIRRTKDKELCPVAAVNEWLAFIEKKKGHVFCKSVQANLWQETRMHPKQLEYVMRRWVRRAKLEAPNDQKFTPHALRAGFITEAARANKPDPAIMQHSRHKTHAVFMGYVRKARPFDNHPAEDLA